MSTAIQTKAYPKPLLDRVLVRELDPSLITRGGIVLPETAQKRDLQRGQVVSMGNGRPLDGGKVLRPENYMQLGDVVYYPAHHGSNMEIDGVKHLILNLNEIFAVDPPSDEDDNTERLDPTTD